jgi:hypothetical protein
MVMITFIPKLYQSAQQIKYASGQIRFRLNNKASSLSFIKGAWALFVLHEQ